MSVKVSVWIRVLLGIAFKVCSEEVLFEDVIECVVRMGRFIIIGHRGSPEEGLGGISMRG